MQQDQGRKTAWLTGSSEITTVLISGQFTFLIPWIAFILHQRPRNWHRGKGVVLPLRYFPASILQMFTRASFTSSTFRFSHWCYGTMKKASQRLSSQVPGIIWLKFYYQMLDIALAFLMLLQLWTGSLIKATTPQMSLHMSFFFFFSQREKSISAKKGGIRILACAAALTKHWGIWKHHNDHRADPLFGTCPTARSRAHAPRCQLTSATSGS